ncbi:histidinol-phosphatase [Pelagibius sp. Alg239-R121]|uniref:histidinol-phosphatase n=1 Tax=Pelagibius sp. Alg239-R121 TaxID=2993448 RepID=UPI0024A67E1B|nr:histidinol-phosphatase [Pelagibius sp. Alg239-R121]
MTENSEGPNCPQQFIDLAESMAEASAKVIRRYFRQAVAVDDKADQSPVTIADRETEATLRQLLAERVPDHGVIGEEQAPTNPDSDYVWVLDPIDGTKRFITGNPLFGTLIALLYKGQPILGVIDMPMLNERWIGARGRQTTFTDHNGTAEVHCRACPGLDKAALASTSPEMFEGGNENAFERVRGAAKLVQYGGDCYSYGLLSSGFTDVVIEAGLGTYDYMALAAVIGGAGGIITDWDGKTLSVDSDGRVVAAGDPACHAEALKRIAGT